MSVTIKNEENATATILDSGNRREFESGAVRDIQEGKGRCDLMPLDVVANVIGSPVLSYISMFQEKEQESRRKNEIPICDRHIDGA